MSDAADHIVDLYERHARAWDKERWRTLFEKPWLDRFLELVPRGGSILDIGCGSGEPIARYFIEAGYDLTGADASPTMTGLCKSRFPNAEWVAADMGTLSLGRRFDGILAWGCFDGMRHRTLR
jgi:SAM-dependent methyltransferase